MNLVPGAAGVKRVRELGDEDAWWDGDDEAWRPRDLALSWYDGWLWVEYGPLSLCRGVTQ